MRKKIICILVMMLFISLAITSTATILTYKKVKEKTETIIKNNEEISKISIKDVKTPTDSDLVTNAVVNYLNIPACAFSAKTESTDYSLETAGNIIGNGYFFAPVYLTKGATITELAAWWRDSSSDEAVLSLYRYDPVLQDMKIIAQVVSIGDQNNYHWSNTQTISRPDVTDGYSYFLVLSLKYNIECYGVRIGFNPPNVGASNNIFIE